MPFLFACPHCGKQTLVADQYAGQRGPCASCGAMVAMPAQPDMQPVAYARPPKSRSLLLVFVAIGGALFVGGAILLALLVPAVQAAREAARRIQCSNNMKQLGLALHNYHQAHGSFPAAALADEEGRPMLSWRVAILPFIEESPLYDQYDSSQDWDAPPNSLLVGQMPQVLKCPSDSSSTSSDTNYVMPSGQEAMGGTSRSGVPLSDCKDGTSNTIMVLEVPDSGIAWTEPRDPTVDEMVQWFSRQREESRAGHPGGINVLFADGSTRFISYSLSTEVFRQLLVRNDGKPNREDVPQ